MSKDKIQIRKERNEERNAGFGERRGRGISDRRGGRGDRRAYDEPRDYRPARDPFADDRRSRSRSPPRRPSIGGAAAVSHLPLPSRPRHRIPQIQILVLDDIQR